MWQKVGPPLRRPVWAGPGAPSLAGGELLLPGWRRLTHPQTPARRLLCTRTFRTAPSGNVLVRRAVDRGPRSCEYVTATPSHGQTLGPAGRALHRPPVGRGLPLHLNPRGAGSPFKRVMVQFRRTAAGAEGSSKT